jgi:adenylyltransferase/sulfurtransferase
MTFGRPSVPSVDAARAAARLAEPTGNARAPLLLDVRERHEFVAARIPGAVLLPTSSFLAGYEALPRDRPLLVFCQSGSRSAAVTGFLMRQGFPDVTNVAGGLEGWLRAGFDVRRGPLAPGEGVLPET